MKEGRKKKLLDYINHTTNTECIFEWKIVENAQSGNKVSCFL